MSHFRSVLGGCGQLEIRAGSWGGGRSPGSEGWLSARWAESTLPLLRLNSGLMHTEPKQGSPQASVEQHIYEDDPFFTSLQGLRHGGNPGRKESIWKDKKKYVKTHSWWGCLWKPALVSAKIPVKWSESLSVISYSSRPHGLYSPWSSQARILEWVAFPFSKESSRPRNWTGVSCIPGRLFNREADNFKVF